MSRNLLLLFPFVLLAACSSGPSEDDAASSKESSIVQSPSAADGEDPEPLTPPPPPPPPPCPAVAAPPPSFCPNGTVTPKKDEAGCVRGFDCVPNPQNACEAKGGRCTGLSPTACPEGFFADANQFSCGAGIGSGCCWACPAIAAPPPSFCPNGTVTPKKDEAGCVRGFDCT